MIHNDQLYVSMKRLNDNELVIMVKSKDVSFVDNFEGWMENTFDRIKKQELDKFNPYFLEV